jgi:hypothetical protein
MTKQEFAALFIAVYTQMKKEARPDPSLVRLTAKQREQLK